MRPFKISLMIVYFSFLFGSFSFVQNMPPSRYFHAVHAVQAVISDEVPSPATAVGSLRLARRRRKGRPVKISDHSAARIMPLNSKWEPGQGYRVSRATIGGMWDSG
jgi:hypothetical protein